MHSQAKDKISEADSRPQRRFAGGGLTWVLVAWALISVAAIAWILPRREPATEPRSTIEVAQGASVSTLVERGYRAMSQRDSDPGAIERALADFERGHALEPNHLDASFGLAWARQSKGLPESEWRRLYESTIGEASLLAYLSLYNLAYAETQAERHEAAVALLERAVQMMPERADGWFALGRAHEAAGDGAAGAEALQRAAELQR